MVKPILVQKKLNPLKWNADCLSRPFREHGLSGFMQITFLRKDPFVSMWALPLSFFMSKERAGWAVKNRRFQAFHLE